MYEKYAYDQTVYAARQQSRFPRSEYCGGGLSKTWLTMPDGSYVETGGCNNPGFAGSWIVVARDLGALDGRGIPVLAKIWLETVLAGGSAIEADAAVMAATEGVRLAIIEAAKKWLAHIGPTDRTVDNFLPVRMRTAG